MRIW